ncbi:MAG: autotransporter outer membrane beta-barrel domain-containing protein [Stenotrophomonas sp.]|uniref:autotransporter family protein n=1 Tax=Stenotrophomonas sp. TaxID=69392 RepID=UPI003D6CA978
MSSGSGSNLVTLDDTTVTTYGTNSHGLEASAGSRLDAANSTVTTRGASAYGLTSAGAGSDLRFEDGQISASGANSIGVLAQTGAHASLTRATVDATATGIKALSGSILQLADVDVQTHQGYAHGVEASGLGSSIAGSNVSVTTQGIFSYGFRAVEGGNVTLEGVRATTAGDYAHGVIAEGTDSIMHVSSVDILTNAGTFAMGARAVAGGAVDIADARVTTHGDGSYGLDAIGAGSQLRATAVDVQTFGGDFDGTTAAGVVAEWGGAVDIQDSTVTTHGTSSIGLLSQVAGNLGDADTMLNASNVQVRTTGEAGFGAMACALLPGSGDSCADAVKSGQTGDGARALLSISHSDIETAGIGGHGLYAYGPAGAQIVARDTRVLTTGEGAHGAVAEAGADIQLVNSSVHAEGLAAAGASVSASTLGMAGGVLDSALGSAIRSDGGRIALSAGAKAFGGNGVFLEQLGGAPSLVSLDENVLAVGDVVLGSGEGVGATSLSLSRNSAWVGKTEGVIRDLSIASGSQWQMTGDASVGNLGLRQGQVVFEAPAGGQFKTLTVAGNFDADQGLLVMNTALGDDSSRTDRLHVLGDTYGTADILVNNIDGRGGLTVDGIKLVEVDGDSAAQFGLAGRAVAGAYEYSLHQGTPTAPENGNWYLRSELPSTPVDPEAPTEPTDPTVPSAPGTPPATHQLRPEAGAYLVNQAAAVGMFNLAMHDRIGEPNLVGGKDDGRAGVAGWARAAGYHANTALLDQLQARSRQHVLQAGADISRWGDTGRGVVGVMVGAGEATTTVTSDSSGYSAEGRVKGQSAGVYGSWVQDPAGDGGLYVDTWAQLGKYRNRVQGEALQAERYDSRSRTASVETGYAFTLRQGANSAVYVEPQAQLTWSDYRMGGGGHDESNGTHVAVSEAGRLRSRVGVRVFGHDTSDGINRVQPYLTANWYHNHGAANAVWLDDVSLSGAAPKDVYEGKAGVQLQLGRGMTAWGELNASRGSNDFRTVGAMMGLKYDW